MQPERRITILSWLIWALLAAGLIGCVFWASPAHATTYSAQDSRGNKVTLSDEKCASGLAWLEQWRKADMFYEGKEYQACWRVVGDYVFVIDSAGDISPIRKEVFAKDQEI